MTIILGIDPGSRITGYGLIEERNNKVCYLDSGCIRTGQGDLSEKLLQIYDGICLLMDRYNPAEAAIEQIFMYKNAASALKLGHARGVAMVAMASHRISVYEYSPREIKQSVSGYGAAEKEQIKQMVMHLLLLNKPPQSDAADALAIALCHSYQRHMRAKIKLLQGNYA
jgi:crossover junction endodeoxyribonuclease RuvC